jgi:hypothetical protein
MLAVPPGRQKDWVVLGSDEDGGTVERLEAAGTSCSETVIAEVLGASRDVVDAKDECVRSDDFHDGGFHG